MAPLEFDRDGFWGKPTATIDWCEANYEISFYIAEFWNTISNLAIFIPPALGTCFAIRDKVEWRFILCHLSLCLVGIGSWMFHQTLLYNMQLMDELPMVWGSGFLVYCMYEMLSPPKQLNKKLTAFLIVYCVVVTIVYLLVKDPLLFQIAYGLMVISLLGPAIGLIRTYPRFLFLLGCCSYVTGFTLWNIDNVFCPQIRNVRSSVGPVLSPITQLHGWWHVFAGLGTFYHLVFTQHTRMIILKKNYELKRYLGILYIPRIKR